MFYRFEPLRNKQGAFLAFGPAHIRIDQFGRWRDHDILHPNPRTVLEVEAVLGTVRGVLPAVMARYRAETGFLKFGKATSSRRWDLIVYIAAALNEAIDGPAAPPSPSAPDAGVFG